MSIPTEQQIVEEIKKQLFQLYPNIFDSIAKPKSRIEYCEKGVVDYGCFVSKYDKADFNYEFLSFIALLQIKKHDGFPEEWRLETFNRERICESIATFLSDKSVIASAMKQIDAFHNCVALNCD